MPVITPEQRAARAALVTKAVKPIIEGLRAMAPVAERAAVEMGKSLRGAAKPRA